MKKAFIETMKKYSFYIILFVSLVTCSAIETRAEQKTDKQIVKQFCRNTYGRGYRIRIKPAEQTTDKMLTNRAGKNTIYVDIWQTKAINRKGGKVTTKGPFKNHYVGYARGTKVKRGQKITVYYIYNPYSNYTDDIAAIVSGGKLETIEY